MRKVSKLPFSTKSFAQRYSMKCSPHSQNCSPLGLLGLALLVVAAVGCQTSSRSAQSEPTRQLNLAERQWTAPDGRHFPLHYWPEDETGFREGSFNHIWIAIHGLGGASSDFHQPAQFLTAAGDAVIAPDLRGMGNDPDPRQRGHLRRGDNWLGDLSSFIDLVHAQHPDTPIFLHGESLGGLLALHLSTKPEVAPRVEGMVLSAPVLFFDAPLPAWQRAMARVVNFVAPRTKIKLTDVRANDQPDLPPVTRDMEILAELQSAPHLLTAFSIGFLYQINQLFLHTPEAIEANEVPTLVLYGERDLFIDPEQMKTFTENWRQHNGALEVVAFPEAHHLLLRDLDAPAVQAAWQAWLEALLGDSTVL